MQARAFRVAGASICDAARRRDTRQAGRSRLASRRRLPGNALVKFDVGLGLDEEVPGRHRLRSILPGGPIGLPAGQALVEAVRAHCQLLHPGLGQGVSERGERDRQPLQLRFGKHAPVRGVLALGGIELVGHGDISCPERKLYEPFGHGVVLLADALADPNLAHGIANATADHRAQGSGNRHTNRPWSHAGDAA